MALPRWQDSGGRDFAFYHSHSGFEWDDVDHTNKYQEMLCHDFQVGQQPCLWPSHVLPACLLFLARLLLCWSGRVEGCQA